MLRISSLRGQTNLILGAFFLLVALSVGITLWSVFTQKNDALIISLAGRQRMLTQQMTWLALNRPDNEELSAIMGRFEQTLQVLRDGGYTSDPSSRSIAVPSAPDAEIKTHLDQVSRTWDRFRNQLVEFGSLSSADEGYAEIAGQIQANSLLILGQLDETVSLYETRAQTKIQRLYWIQGGFLIIAFALLVWGSRLMRERLISPVMALGMAAHRIGKGDLDNPVGAHYQGELGQLAQALETMRRELAYVHQSLEDRVANRTRELTTAFEFSQEIVAQLELEHLLRSVVERTRALTLANTAALCLLNGVGDELELSASIGGAPMRPGLRQAVGCGLAVHVIGKGQTQVGETLRSGCGYLRAQGGGQCMAAPLMAGGQIQGALCLSRSGNLAFDEDEKRALSLLANSAAIAITNARLTADRQRETQRTAALAERERMAADLHDNLAQTLSYLRIKAEYVERAVEEGQRQPALDTLSHIKDNLGRAYTQVREALTSLRESAPVEENLAHELADCVAEFRELTGVPIELDIEDPVAMNLSPGVQVQVTHIVRGALANVHRHAQAHRIQLQVALREGVAWFTVVDDGVGFDIDAVKNRDHLGMEIMQTRAERSGGKFAIESAPDQGTRVMVYFPLPQTHDA